MLWLIFIPMTAAAIFAVLWPLSRRSAQSFSGTGIAVYRDQLEEIERDRTAGLIGAAEAEAARVEVSRRLLSVAEAEKSETQKPAPPWRRRAVALIALVALPLGAIAFYLLLGSPQLANEHVAARPDTPLEQRSIESLVAQVESHLERNPNDGRGWEVLAP